MLRENSEWNACCVMTRMGAQLLVSGPAILDEKFPPFEVGEQPGPERLVHTGVEGAVRRSPLDRPFASGFPHEESVIGGPAGVLAGPHNEGTGSRQVPFATPQRLLEQRRTREVPPDGLGLPDSVEGEIVCPVPVRMSTQGEPPRCRRSTQNVLFILPPCAAERSMAGGGFAGYEPRSPLRIAARAAGAAVGPRVGGTVLLPAGRYVGVDQGERPPAVRMPWIEVRRCPGAVPGAVRMVLHHRKVFADEPLDSCEEGALVGGAERHGIRRPPPGPFGRSGGRSFPARSAGRSSPRATRRRCRCRGRRCRWRRAPSCAPLEVLQCPLAGVLGLVAVDRLGPDAGTAELPDDLVGAVLGAREDHRALDGRPFSRCASSLIFSAFST